MFTPKDKLIAQAKQHGQDSWTIENIKGDEHRRDNGRIIVRIIVENKGSSIRVSLRVKNSGELQFYPADHGEKELFYSTVFKQESVDKRVEEYKDQADDLFIEYLYPRYCYEANEIKTLGKLLCIVDEEP